MNDKRKIVALVQARMGSVRLPGKMIKKLDQKTILEWVLTRVSKAKLIDEVILITSTLSRDDILEKIAKKLKINTFRGSEEDVLDRFTKAAANNKAEIIVRVCADNPFIDGFEIDRLINFYLKNNYDYCFNNNNKFGCNYADGFGAEIFSIKVLNFLDNNIFETEDREHVTLAIFKKFFNFKISPIKAPFGIDFPELKFDLDNKKDFTKLKKLIEFGVNIKSSAVEIIKIARELNL